MSCRIGMSTEPDKRIQYWKDKEGHEFSEILADRLTYAEATVLENYYAEDKGCRQSPGGKDVEGAVWFVYHVWGGN